MAKKKTKKNAAKRSQARAKNMSADVMKTISALVDAAADGNPGAKWLHEAITKAGYVRRGDRATKQELSRYGREVGRIFESLIEKVAAVDAALSREVHAAAVEELERLSW